MALERTVIDTPFGPVAILTEDGRLRQLDFVREAPTRPKGGGPIVRELRRYFRGVPTDFRDVRLDLRGTTDFERRVYEATRSIPFGKVASYGQIAKAIGEPRAARAVGNALHKNPISIVVPCHRVVASDGLGGYGNNIELKKRLLRLEGALRPVSGATGRGPRRSPRSGRPGPRGPR